MFKTISLQALMLSFPLLVSTPTQADQADSQAYANMQDCLATAVDVPDAGSYYQFCIEQYLASVNTQKED